MHGKETVMRHASPPSKKRKPAKIGFSSKEAQHPLIGDAWRCELVRDSSCGRARVLVSFCFMRHELA